MKNLNNSDLTTGLRQNFKFSSAAELLQFWLLAIQDISSSSACSVKDENNVISISPEKVYLYNGSLLNSVICRLSETKYTPGSFSKQISQKLDSTNTVTLLFEILKAKNCSSQVPGWTGLQQEWSSGLTETSDRVSLAQSDWYLSKDCFHF